jgi:hypothetical protein
MAAMPLLARSKLRRVSRAAQSLGAALLRKAPCLRQQ